MRLLSSSVTSPYAEVGRVTTRYLVLDVNRGTGELLRYVDDLKCDAVYIYLHGGEAELHLPPARQDQQLNPANNPPQNQAQYRRGRSHNVSRPRCLVVASAEGGPLGLPRLRRRHLFGSVQVDWCVVIVVGEWACRGGVWVVMVLEDAR